MYILPGLFVVSSVLKLRILIRNFPQAFWRETPTCAYVTHSRAPQACCNMMLSGQNQVVRMTEAGIGGHRHSLSVIQLPVANRLLRGVWHWAGQIPAPDTHSTCQLGKRPPSLDPVCVLRCHCVHLLTYKKLIVL